MKIRQDLLKSSDEPDYVTVARECFFLNCRWKAGFCRALPYGLITQIHFDPEQGIQVEGANIRIILAGEGLEELYRLLLEHRVAEVRETQSETTTFFETLPEGRIARIIWESITVPTV